MAVDVTPLRSGADMSLPLAGAAPALATAALPPLYLPQNYAPQNYAAPAYNGALPPASALAPAAAMAAFPLTAQERAERERSDRSTADRGQAAAAGATTVASRVQSWARSLRNRDLTAVTNFYAPGYKGSAASPAAWALQQKRQLAGKGELDLEIEDVTVKDLPGGQVESRFLQSMTTANGIEVNNVAQTWQQVGGQWRIVRERRL